MDGMRSSALSGLMLCVQVWGSSCDEDCPLKLKSPSLGNSLVVSNLHPWDGAGTTEADFVLRAL